MCWRAEAWAFHCNICGGRCESVTTASCAHCYTHTHTQIQDDFGDYAQQCGSERENSITMHPLITCCSPGRPLSLSFTASSWGGGGLWPLSQHSLGNLFQLLQLHTLPNLNPTSLTTAAACVLSSLSRRPRTGSSEQHIRNAAETSQRRPLTRRRTDMTSLCGSCSSQGL